MATADGRPGRLDIATLARQAGAMLAATEPAAGNVVPLNRARRRAITAAGKRLELTVKRTGQKVLRDPEQWQSDVWTYYDTVPEVKYIGRFYGNALSRIRLVPAWVVDGDAIPFDQLDDPDLDLDPADRPPAGLAEACQAQTDRLASSSDGMAGIMRAFGENLGLVGDCYLLGRSATDDDDVVGDEVWQVYSTDALTEEPTGGDGQAVKVMVQETPDGKATPLPEGADPVVYRVWRRHARWPGLADSNMHACLDEAEELLVWSKMLRAIGNSGANAGLLLVPTELELESDGQRALADDIPDPDPGDLDLPDPDPLDGAPADDMSDLEQTLMQQFLLPAQQEGTGALVAPVIVRGKAEYLAQVRFLLLERGIDDKVIDRIEFLIRRMAHGADLPVEVLTGVADANHWTGWQIEDATYKAHVEPTAQIPAAALTACHLRPNLPPQYGPEVLRRVVYALDPSALVVRPNRAEDARQLWDRFALSDDALLEAHSFPTGSAPTDEELVRRYLLLRSGAGPQVTAQLMNQTITEDAPIDVPTSDRAPSTSGPSDGDGDDTTPEDGGDPIPSTGPSGARTGLVAAGALPNLGGQLASIERRLRERLQSAATRELEQVLRRAGSRLRGAVQGTPAAAEVNGQPAEVVGLLLGQERAADVVDPEALLAGAFLGLRDQWDTWVAQAEAEATAAVNAATPDDATTVEVTDPAASDRGWEALLAGLLGLARVRLFAAVDDEPGEVDAHSAVPAGIVRDALAVAGGGSPGVAPFGTASQSGPAGLLTGPRWTRVLSTVGINRDAWTWQTGFPTSPFEPHQRLSGTIFETWDDPALSNGSSWPRTSHYYPGDHRGCQCDAIPVLVAQAARRPAGAA